mgnify:CR=1 FL=1
MEGRDALGMAFDKRTLVLPEGAVFEERTLATLADLILARSRTGECSG